MPIHKKPLAEIETTVRADFKVNVAMPVLRIVTKYVVPASVTAGVAVGLVMNDPVSGIVGGVMTSEIIAGGALMITDKVLGEGLEKQLNDNSVFRRKP